MPMVVIFAFAALTRSAMAEQIGPSFDCHKAQQPLAQMLCADPDLSRTDLRFAQAYFALLRQVGDAGKGELKQEELQFLETVQQQCGIPRSGPVVPQSEASRNCVKTAYEKQRSVWVSRLTSLSLEEADRPIERHIALQRSLQQLGFLPADAIIDGVYGTGTREAISQWQRSHNRSVTGALGDDDAQALRHEGATAAMDRLTAGAPAATVERMPAAPQGSSTTSNTTPLSRAEMAPSPHREQASDVATPGAYVYQGFDVKSPDCLAFWRNLDAPVFANKDSWFSVGAGKEEVTGGDILVGVQGITGRSCFDLGGGPTPVWLELPDGFNLRLLLDDSYVARVTKNHAHPVDAQGHHI
jgi:uncharacterized protein